MSLQPDRRAATAIRVLVVLLHVIPASTRAAPASLIDVRAYGARGDGRTDDRRAIQSALDAAAPGGTVFFPASPAGYLVLGALRPHSGTTLAGDGFESLLRLPDGGWDVRTLPGTQNYGLITLEGVSRVRITGLRLRGALRTPSLPDGGPDFRFTPQLIQISNTNDAVVEDVVIDHCRFESNRVNAIWEGGPTPGPRRVTITDNVFEDIGWEPSLPVPPGVAVQATVSGGIISRNLFRHVAGAIAATGEDLIVADNVIRDVLAHGIMTGDHRVLGNVVITGNVITTRVVGTDWSKVLALRGITVANAWPGEAEARGFVVSNNIVDFTIGTRTLNEVVAFGAVDTSVALSANAATMRFAVPWRPGDGIIRGFKLGASERRAYVKAIGNSVAFVAHESARPGTGVYGFVAAPVARPGGLTILSTMNTVSGLEARGNGDPVAWDYHCPAGESLTVRSRDDHASGGLVRMGTFIDHRAVPFSMTWQSAERAPDALPKADRPAANAAQ